MHTVPSCSYSCPPAGPLEALGLGIEGEGISSLHVVINDSFLLLVHLAGSLEALGLESEGRGSLW